MVKSLGNPFKSILKLGVLNKYLFDNANAPLLSQKIKYLIQQGNFSNTILDSYLMMFTEVSDYYKRSGANECADGQSDGSGHPRIQSKDDRHS